MTELDKYIAHLKTRKQMSKATFARLVAQKKVAIKNRDQRFQGPITTSSSYLGNGPFMKVPGNLNVTCDLIVEKDLIVGGTITCVERRTVYKDKVITSKWDLLKMLVGL